ncbi:MAG TPA: hypothetical protein VG867_09680 [Rhizomicrobium sp.]|nr:hypothetical protein [Rhizomicrobium sp.]
MGKGSQIESNGMGKGTESNGMGKGHAAEAMPPPPPPVTESNGMGKGKALRVACHVTAINRAQRSFRCRMHGHSLKFYMTGASELRRGNRAVSFRHLQVGQSVRVRYFRDTVRTVDRATILR